MRLVIQRVLEAAVSVGGQEVSRIGPGLVILLGIQREDNIQIVQKWAEKAFKIKLWNQISNKQEQIQENDKKQLPDKESQQQQQEQDNQQQNQEEEKQVHKGAKEEAGWKTSVQDNNYEILVVSQFTLYGYLKGNKPDFHKSMPADEARKLYEEFLTFMKKKYNPEKVKGGAFQEYMHVSLVNDGPVTLTIDDELDENQKNKSKDKKK